jgi:hypothetical protein
LYARYVKATVAAAITAAILSAGITFLILRSGKPPGETQAALICSLVKQTNGHYDVSTFTGEQQISAAAAMAPPSAPSPFLEVIVDAKAYAQTMDAAAARGTVGAAFVVSGLLTGEALAKACDSARLLMTPA